MERYDFSGWATRHNMKCSDGRTIMKDAFKHQDGMVVPLVWNHRHDDPANVLGHATLENREEGVYAYCSFNETENGQYAKEIVKHKDIVALSIYANHLKQEMHNVMHGMIREVSLVHAGANPGAFIDAVLMHSDDETQVEAGIIYTGEEFELYHAEEESKEEEPMEEETKKEKTVQDVIDSMTEEQQNVMYALIGEAVGAGEEDEEETEVKHNVFDKNTENTMTELSHSEMTSIVAEAKKSGSLRDAFAAHGYEELTHAVTDENGATVTYGMANINYLFPDARNVHNVPDFIARDMGWVNKVMNGAKHLPFSRVKSVHANITMEEARAKGYIKTKEKVNEVFALLKRITTPTTIYKKQKLDRDDVIDITDFDVIAWLKREMRMMLDEEIARAALIGDGRPVGHDEHIPEENIRPIWKDNGTYVVRTFVDAAEHTGADARAKAFIRAVIKARKDYKGSGNPTLFTTEDQLTDCLLLEDRNGRVIYDTVEKLRNALRVSDIVTVPVMENLSREANGTAEAGYTYAPMGILVNMADYAFGADKGGAVNMFDDFDIDFNQQKYLIETRCSGALIKPYSAIVVELKTATAATTGEE